MISKSTQPAVLVLASSSFLYQKSMGILFVSKCRLITYTMRCKFLFLMHQSHVYVGALMATVVLMIGRYIRVPF